MKKIAPQFIIFGFALLCLCTSEMLYAQTADKDKKDKVFYRYLDDKGVKAISPTIPPEAIARGYEIIDLSGLVLKSVAPAATDPNQAALDRKAAKEQAKIDLELRRNYSTPQDIDAAKIRKLQQLHDTVEILEGSLISVRSQLKLNETNAANIERSGKPIPDDVLKNITKLRTQEKDAQQLIQTREQELKQASDKFDKDRERFILITKDTKPADQ
jgi:hypothetical protein